MTTAREIVTNALRTVGVIAEGQPLLDDDAASALIRLNDLLDSWATESFYAYSIAEYVTTITGATLTLPTPFPARIEGGFVRSGTVDYSFSVVDYAAYADIAMKGLTGSFPTVAYYNGNGVLSFYPVPSGGELHLPLLQRLGEFADLDTNYTLPPGYRRALAYSLAEDLAIDYSRALSPLALKAAAAARRTVKRANHRVPQLGTPYINGYQGPVVLGGGDGADVYRGGNAGST